MKFPLILRRRLEKSEARFRERIEKLKRKVDGLQRTDDESNHKFQQQKIFCVGLNKTGTTSLERVFEQFGFSVGNWRSGELLFEEWAARDFEPIVELCHTADAFQDCPFSLPFTYMPLDAAFPNAKFILTVRDDPEQWWQSLTRFHSKLWADGERIPTREDLEKADYVYPGRPWRSNQLTYGTPVDDPYEKETLFGYYQRHNASVIDYFRHRPDKLIVINVSRSEDYGRLCRFLDVEPVGDDFPWLNKT